MNSNNLIIVFSGLKKEGRVTGFQPGNTENLWKLTVAIKLILKTYTGKRAPCAGQLAPDPSCWKEKSKDE